MGSLAPLWWKHKGLTVFTGAVIALLGVLAAFGGRGLLQVWRLQDELRRVEVEAMQLQQGNEALRTHLRRLGSDPTYAERIVRTRLGWMKAGELVYRVPRASARTERAVE